MSSTWLLGLDLGGGSVRCAAVDPETGSLRVASRAWSALADPRTPGGTLFDPEAMRARLAEVVAESLRRAGAAPASVRGIACASMRHASVLLGNDGAVLLATTNRDARGMASIMSWAEIGEELLRRTGHWPHPVLPAGRLHQIAGERPDLLERARAHLAPSDWIGHWLSGEIATDPTQAGETLCLDLATRAWADDLIAELGLPRRLFPRLLEPGSRLGSLREEAAEQLGLPAGIPVAVGGADTQCALLGCGALGVGQAAVVAGTTAPVQRVVSGPTVGPGRAARGPVVDARLWTGQASTPDTRVLESNAGGVGEALEWIASALYAGTAHPVLHLLEAASRAEPGAQGLLSTFGADVMDARAPVLPVGHLAISPVSVPDTGERRIQMARAALEGLAFGLRANLEQLEAVAGACEAPLHLVGGLARSDAFARLLADVCDREVSVPRAIEATAFGAALCAGVGAGVFADLAEAASACVREDRRLAPEPAARDVHRVSYPAWCEVREAQADARARAGSHALRFLLAGGAAEAARPEPFRPKVLVTSDMDDSSLAALREMAEVEYASFRDAGRLLTGDALVEALAGVHVLVTEIDVAKADALMRCRDLRVIVACRGDVVNVDVVAATALGIPVLNTPGRNADAVADLTVAFLLALARKLVAADAFLHEEGGEAGDLGRMGQAFVRFQGRELWRRNVGLVGLGAVGRKVVARLLPFGARCRVHDPFLPPDAIRLAGAEPVDLDTLLATSDFVSLHAPVTDASRGMIGANQLARMRPGSFLVNTARAALLDEDALAEALASEHLGGAALDVFSVEPPASDHPLLRLPNVIATPHVGGNTVDVAAHQGEIVVNELRRLLRGGRPAHILNPETLADFSWHRSRPEPPADFLERLGDRKGPAVTDLVRDAEES